MEEDVTYITTEKTIVRNYRLLMAELQNHLNISHIPESLRPALLAKRPKKFRKLPWKIAMNRILLYVKTHKHNFVDGGLRV